jgi:hypothetical protein
MAMDDRYGVDMGDPDDTPWPLIVAIIVVVGIIFW